VPRQHSAVRACTKVALVFVRNVSAALLFVGVVSAACYRGIAPARSSVLSCQLNMAQSNSEPRTPSPGKAGDSIEEPDWAEWPATAPDSALQYVGRQLNTTFDFKPTYVFSLDGKLRLPEHLSLKDACEGMLSGDAQAAAACYPG